jgi:hypothetical protein
MTGVSRYVGHADVRPGFEMRWGKRVKWDLDWYKHRERVEYGIVRVAHLLQPDRTFQGAKNVCRAPEVGDIGTIVFAYDKTSFAVECVNKEGMTVWLADFFAEELEFLKECAVGPKAAE